MKDFATLPFTLGAFPDVLAKDSSGGAAVDGTPLLAQWLSEVFGFTQALLDATGLTPDAATEAPDTSQIMEAIQLMSGYPGEIVMFAHVTIPTGARLLALEGQGILRANYARLDAAVYCGNAANGTAPAYYRADDAAGTSRNIAGVWLILPDLRGVFTRGLDLSGLHDPGGGPRSMGDFQEESIKQHEHDKIWHSTWEVKAGNTPVGSGASQSDVSINGTAPLKTGATGSGIGATVTNETRPDNSAVKYCIRF